MASPPQPAGLGKLGVAWWIFVVALDLWDHLGRRVTPMLPVYATATVVVTVAAGTRCAWYGLTGPLDAEQSPPGPGTCHLILYFQLLTPAAPYLSYCGIGAA